MLHRVGNHVAASRVNAKYDATAAKKNSAPILCTHILTQCIDIRKKNTHTQSKNTLVRVAAAEDRCIDAIDRILRPARSSVLQPSPENKRHVLNNAITRAHTYTLTPRTKMGLSTQRVVGRGRHPTHQHQLHTDYYWIRRVLVAIVLLGCLAESAEGEWVTKCHLTRMLLLRLLMRYGLHPVRCMIVKVRMHLVTKQMAGPTCSGACNVFHMLLFDCLTRWHSGWLRWW